MYQSTIQLTSYILQCEGYYNGSHSTQYHFIQYEFDSKHTKYSHLDFSRILDNLSALWYFSQVLYIFFILILIFKNYVVQLDYGCKFI